MAELILPLALLAVLWFIMIRPQQKRRKEHQEMVRTLGVGDEIVTIGGLHGRIVGLADGTMDIEVTADSDVTLRFERNALARVVPVESEPSGPSSE